MEQYYSEKEQKAQKELALLVQDANGQQEGEGFEITQERIDVINKATEYINSVGNFAEWCEINFYGGNVEQCYNVFEDFVNSIDHITPKIDEIMNE